MGRLVTVLNVLYLYSKLFENGLITFRRLMGSKNCIFLAWHCVNIHHYALSQKSGLTFHRLLLHFDLVLFNKWYKLFCHGLLFIWGCIYFILRPFKKLPCGIENAFEIFRMAIICEIGHHHHFGMCVMRVRALLAFVQLWCEGLLNSNQLWIIKTSSQDSVKVTEQQQSKQDPLKERVRNNGLGEAHFAFHCCWY